MFRLLLATAAATLVAGASYAEGSVEDGKKVFRRCKSCHAVGEDAKNKIGPVLNNIVDQPVGQNPDFRYSDGMIAAANDGVIWDEEALAKFLSKPRSAIEGTSMSFAGLRKEKDIANIIAYLRSFSDAVPE